MSDAPRVTAETLDRLREVELAAALAKLEAGKPLTRRERELVEAEAATARPAAAPEFRLDSADSGHALDDLTQEQLAGLWGYSVRQLKNWLSDGKRAGDPAPIRRPEAMPAWFERVYAPREAPDRLRQAALKLASGGAAAGPPAFVADKREKPCQVEVSDAEKGVLATLGRLEEAEVTLHRKYLAAVEAGEETKAQFLFSEWTKTAEKLRAYQKSAPATLEQLGVYVRKSEVAKELRSLHSAILSSFRQAFRRAGVRLHSAGTAAEWGAEVDRVVDEVGQQLADTGFAEPLDLVA